MNRKKKEKVIRYTLIGITTVFIATTVLGIVVSLF